MTQNNHESESIAEWLVRETKRDLSNADWSVKAGVRAIIEASLGLALVLRIVRDSLAYGATQDAPGSTRWTLTLGPQLPEREARRHSRSADFYARMMMSLGLVGLATVPWSVSSPVVGVVAGANWLVLVLDPIFGAVYWFKEGR